MTPIYLNPPPSHSSFTFVEVKDEELKLFLSPQPQAIPSSLSHHHQDQRVVLTQPDEAYSKPLDHKVYDNFLTHEGSSDHQQASSSCSSVQSIAADHAAANGGRTLSFSTKEDSESASENNGSSAKWMSSKMRIMRKMMESNSGGKEVDDNYIDKQVKYTGKVQSPVGDSDKTNFFTKTAIGIRICSDCNTTTTPLWRSGPRGPKSLCNACGIRKRKARRAMEVAAAVAKGGATDASSVKIKVQMNKEKKSRTSHVGQYKKQYSPSHVQSQKKLCSFKDFALRLSKNSALQSVFPQDVEDAAILLMELSCGLVHS